MKEEWEASARGAYRTKRGIDQGILARFFTADEFVTTSSDLYNQYVRCYLPRTWPEGEGSDDGNKTGEKFWRPPRRARAGAG